MIAGERIYTGKRKEERIDYKTDQSRSPWAKIIPTVRLKSLRQSITLE